VRGEKGLSPLRVPCCCDHIGISELHNGPGLNSQCMVQCVLDLWLSFVKKYNSVCHSRLA
jgi:hypothetical protein